MRALMRASAAALLAVAAALTVTGCDPNYAEGPAGRVVDKDRHYTRGAGWKFELTVRTSSGDETEFRVKHSVYRGCVRGATYPKCAGGA